jgi:hypothetical protein
MIRPGDVVIDAFAREHMVERVEGRDIWVRGYRCEASDGGWNSVDGISRFFPSTPENVERALQRVQAAADRSSVYAAYCEAAKLLKNGVDRRAGAAARDFLAKIRQL